MDKTIENIYSLTPLQQGILYETQMNAAIDNLYVSQLEIKVTGPLKAEAFERSWNTMICRHEALRSRVFLKGVENPVQVIFKQAPQEVTYLDLSHLQIEFQAIEIDKKKKEAMNIHVDAEHLMNVLLFKIDQEDYLIIWTHHHIMLDGWSTSIVLNELFECYHSLINKEKSHLQSSNGQFGDYIRYIHKADENNTQKFWGGLVNSIEKPTISFVSSQTGKVEREDGTRIWELSFEKSQRLKAYASKHQVTLNSVMQLAWGLLLKQLSGEKQVVFGIVNSGRTPELIHAEKIVGLLINTVPLVMNFDEMVTIEQGLKQTQSIMNEIVEYSHCSLIDIKSNSKLKKGANLFETLFVFENYPEAGDEAASTLEWELIGGRESHSFPLSIQVQDVKGVLTCKLFYDRQFVNDSLAHSIETVFTDLLTKLTSIQYIEQINEEIVSFSKVYGASYLEEKERSQVTTVAINEQLKTIWQEFFPSKAPEGHDDFFELGGHSITAMKFVAKLKKQLNLDVALKDLFTNSTLESLNETLFSTDSDDLREVVTIVEKAFLEVLDLEKMDHRADFFEEGGHSIRAMKLLSKLNKELPDTLELKSIFKNPSIQRLTNHIVNNHKIQREEQLETDEEKTFRLSNNQESLWFDEKVTGLSNGYTIPQKYQITGDVDISKLEKALNRVIKRHSSLQTVIKEEKGIGYQCILKDSLPTIEEINLSALNEIEQEESLQLIEDQMMAESFDLENGPLLSVKLARLSEHHSKLFVNIHHIIFDGWSVGVFFNEWLSFYEDEMLNQTTFVPTEVLQYKDFAHEQRKRLEDSYEEDIQFWKEHLPNPIAKLDLPYQSVLSNKTVNNGESLIVRLTTQDLNRLKEMSMNQNSTLFITMLTMYQCFLSRYTGQHEIIVGSSMANRMIPGSEHTIGYFVNTLPFRLELHHKETFSALLRKNTDHCIDVFDQQHMPIEKIIEAVNLERDETRSSLFDTVFVLQNNEKATFTNKCFQLKPEIVKANTAKFNLSLLAEEDQDGMLLAFQYNTDLFNKQTIQDLTENFLDWVKTISLCPNETIASFSLMNASQEKKVVKALQGEVVDFAGKEDSIPSAFYKVVNAFPEKMAVKDDEKWITYAELNRRSNKLAHVLIEKGLEKEAKVGIYMNRSIEMVIGILAVIKAGGAYVPLDPHYPNERLKYITQDTELAFCLTEKDIKNIDWLECVERISMDSLSVCDAPAANVFKSSSADLAYVIYTSGTTGDPKGVMIEHRGIINLVYNQKDMLCLTSSAKVLQFATFNFDSSVIEIFSSLLFGAELHISTDKENQFDLNQLINQIKRDKISHLILPPVILKELPIQDLESLQVVGSAGSECPVEMVSKYKDVIFFNGYGPSEYSVCTSYKVFHPGEQLNKETIVPIGKPVTNTNILILDRNMSYVPIDVVGELFVGGRGIARGYLNKKRLTDQRFVQNPYCPEEQIYKTGDLVKLNHQGELVYAGRTDDQFKIRGYRVELSEVEYAFRKVDKVKDCFINVSENQVGHKRIVAYYILHEAFSVVQLRRALKKLLPSFMIPSYFVEMKKFPLTTNGKIDRNALPKTFDKPDKPASFEWEQLSMVEKDLLAVWRECLVDETVGLDDNFFECGGDSIISIQVCSLAKEKQIYLTPKDLFEHQTIRALAEVAQQNARPTIEQDKVSGEILLTPIQQWFFNEKHKNINHWNQSIVLQKEPNLTLSQYKEIIYKMVAHHDGLRTLFKKEPKGFVGEIVHAPFACAFEEHVFDHLATREVMEKIRVLEEEAQRSLNIFDGPTMKFLLFRSPNQVRIFWVIHHLLIDGVSWRILLEDFEKGCLHISQDKELQLPPKTHSYKQWAKQLRDFEENHLTNKTVKYWQEELSHSIPFHQNAFAEIDHGTKMHEIIINKKQTNHLVKQITTKFKTSVDEVLLSMIAKVVTEQMNIPELWIDLEGHGREEVLEGIDITRTVGWFTTSYPVRLKGQETLAATLKGAKKRLRAIPNKGFDYSILKYFSEKKIPTLESYISYNYLGQFNGMQHDSRSFSNNIDPDYVFPYKLNFTATILNGQLTIMVLGDMDNDHVKQICNRLNSLLDLLYIEEGLLQESISVTDFNEGSLIDEETAAFFMNKFSHVEEIYPVTPLQEGMLFHSEKQKGDEYISQLTFTIKGMLDVSKLEKAWNDMCRKYDVLRSIFQRNPWGDQFQVVLNNIYYVFQQIDLTGFGEEQQEERLSEIAKQTIQRSIDLEKGPLMNIIIVKRSDSRHQFIWTHHHALLDGWSLQVVMQQFLKCYNSSTTSTGDHEYEKNVYKQLIQRFQKNERAQESIFWGMERANFSEIKTITPVPQTALTSSLDKVLEFSLSPDLTHTLLRISKQYKVTMNTVVQGIWSLTLMGVSQNSVICYGVTSSGRNVSIPGVNEAVGMFINTLPFVLRLEKDMDFNALLNTIQSKQAQLREYEYTPLLDIRRYFEVPWDQDLFNHIFVYENYPVNATAEHSDIQIENSSGIESTNFDLTFSAALLDYKLHGKMIYKETLYTEMDISQIIDRFKSIALSVAKDENKAIDLTLNDLKIEV